MPPSSKDIHRYHDGTKHHFHRFARSMGYLDWASQPAPFRTFHGSRLVALRLPPFGHDFRPPDVSYDQLFLTPPAAAPLCVASLADLLRHSLGLSAWKQAGSSRWSLRVNPSSGNLHPTEACVVCGPMDGLSGRAGVYHYAADRHALEERCAFDASAWGEVCDGRDDIMLVALTSIHWREAWKYGERAFRYCQHDIGHAIGALALAAAALGWEARLLQSWSQAEVAALVGLDRDDDFLDAEREEPACLIAIGHAGNGGATIRARETLAAIRCGTWSGRASQLSEDHVQWTFIDEIADVTRTEGSGGSEGPEVSGTLRRSHAPAMSTPPAAPAAAAPPALPAPPAVPARQLFLQRRSAVAFDRVTHLERGSFFRMLARVLPRAGCPWQALWWEPRIQLVLFVHRVHGVEPGLYLLKRSPDGGDRLRAAMKREFTGQPVDEGIPLVQLAAGDCRALARRLSCDQDIAADGCFSLGMIAEFDRALDQDGPAAYRQLFWEAGLVGQVLYLESEAAGIRATGIGCFYDDPVHEVLGLDGHGFQSLYHFTVGGPVEDRRISSAPGYSWEESTATPQGRLT